MNNQIVTPELALLIKNKIWSGAKRFALNKKYALMPGTSQVIDSWSWEYVNNMAKPVIITKNYD